MDELRVPTRRVIVDVFLADGTCATGTLFHSESLYQSGGPGDILEELNDEREFVPFAAIDDAVGASLLSKRHVLRVRVHELKMEDLQMGQREAAECGRRCTLLLDDGSRITGRLALETPLTASRLVDKFNMAPSFLPFVTDECVELVHASHVVRVFRND